MLRTDDGLADLAQDREELLAGGDVKTEYVVQLLCYGRAYIFVAQAVVDREIAGDFPIILGVEILRVIPEMGLRSADGAAHLRGIAEQKVRNPSPVRRRDCGHRTRAQSSLTGSERSARAVVGIDKHARLADFRAELQRMATLDHRKAIRYLVAIDSVALCQTVAADSAVPVQPTPGTPQFAGAGGYAGDADRRGDDRSRPGPARRTVPRAVIRAKDIDDCGGDGGRQLRDFVSAGRLTCCPPNGTSEAGINGEFSHVCRANSEFLGEMSQSTRTVSWLSLIF